MGTPTKATWPEGLRLAAAMNFRFPQFSPVPLSKLVASASPDALDLMTGLCAWCALYRTGRFHLESAGSRSDWAWHA